MVISESLQIFHFEAAPPNPIIITTSYVFHSLDAEEEQMRFFSFESSWNFFKAKKTGQ